MTDNETAQGVKAALRALAVAAALLAALLVASRLFEPKTNNSEFGLFDAGTSGIAAEPQDTIDVVVVGDSLALNSFWPKQFWGDRGYTLFVCSSLAQKLPEGYTMLSNALKNQSPKVVLIETHDVFVPFTWEFALLNELQMHLPILRYHSRWRVFKPSDLVTRPEATWIDPHKGARIENQTDAVDGEDLDEYLDQIDETSAAEEIDTQGDLFLGRMVDACEEAGAIPVLVSVPSVVDWSAERHNAVEAWAKEHGVSYLDLNLSTEEIGLDWSTDSKDGGDHLNASGAEKFSHYMSALLDDEYDLPDHRGDSAYASWEAL
ncbi:MAG: SGNH/GDSL hydrolase family protein [Atopobiaceae bacterium]|nr:SGNH/GDSL hydrolase family protein [Atopobiaceae bacterium]